MVVFETLFHVVIDPLGGEWWKVWMIGVVFQIAESVFASSIWVSEHLVLFLFNGVVLIVVSVKEVVDSIYTWPSEEFWKVKHHDFLVLWIIIFEDSIDQELERLILVEFHGLSQSCNEIEVNVDNFVGFCCIDVHVVFQEFLVSCANVIDE